MFTDILRFNYGFMIPRPSIVFRFDKAMLLEHAAAQLSFLLVLVPIHAIGQSPTHKRILFICIYVNDDDNDEIILQVDSALLPMSGPLLVFFFTNTSVVYITAVCVRL